MGAKLSASVHNTLSYDVPMHASPADQKLALVAALAYAHVLERHLEIPQVYSRGRPVAFRMMFRIRDETIHDLLVPRISQCDKTSSSVSVSEDLLLMRPELTRRKHICLGMEDLLSSSAHILRRDQMQKASCCAIQ